MHRELLQRWDERSGPRGSASPSFDRLKNIEKPRVAPKKWLVCKRGKPSSYWGIANEFNIVQYVHSYRSCPCQIYPTLFNEVYIPNPIEWGLQSSYWRSQMTGLKVNEVWTSVCKPWTQSPEMWPGGIKDYQSTWNDARWSLNLLKQFWEHLGKQFHAS